MAARPGQKRPIWLACRPASSAPRRLIVALDARRSALGKPIGMSIRTREASPQALVKERTLGKTSAVGSLAKSSSTRIANRPSLHPSTPTIVTLPSPSHPFRRRDPACELTDSATGHTDDAHTIPQRIHLEEESPLPANNQDTRTASPAVLDTQGQQAQQPVQAPGQRQLPA